MFFTVKVITAQGEREKIIAKSHIVALEDADDAADYTLIHLSSGQIIETKAWPHDVERAIKGGHSDVESFIADNPNSQATINEESQL